MAIPKTDGQLLIVVIKKRKPVTVILKHIAICNNGDMTNQRDDEKHMFTILDVM